MTLTGVLDEIKLNLGVTSGFKTKIELNEKDLTAIVMSSLRELTTLMDTPMITTVAFQEIIDISNLKLASVVNIMRAEAPAGTLQGVSLDPFYLSGVTNVVQPGTPNTHSVLQTQASYAIRSMAQRTVQEDLSWITDFYNKKLYVSFAGIRPRQITIIYKPIVESVEDLPSDYWTTFLIRLATAHGKIIIGRVRSKYAVSNVSYTVNDNILAEGLEELRAIREELKKVRGAFFG